MLRQRLLTAAVLVCVALGLSLMPAPGWFILACSILIIMSAWEWAALCHLARSGRLAFCLLVMFILAGLYRQDDPALLGAIVTAGVVYWLFAIGLVLACQSERYCLPRSASVRLLLGLFTLLPMWAGLILLKSFITGGASLLLCLLLLVWSADTAAYFAGKRWGRRALASHISPAKTREGALAALIAAIVIGLGYVIVADRAWGEAWMFVLLSLITATVSIFGDLMESLLKRAANVKDSGTLLPGHGGLLDRIDSLAAASPVFAFAVCHPAGFPLNFSVNFPGAPA